MGKTQYNVSARLDDKDYNELKFLHKLHNRTNRTKISLADCIRFAINDMYDIEVKKEENRGILNEFLQELKQDKEDKASNLSEQEAFIKSLEAMQKQEEEKAAINHTQKTVKQSQQAKKGNTPKTAQKASTGQNKQSQTVNKETVKPVMDKKEIVKENTEANKANTGTK